jgi:ubiquinone/menaquinone biosynthesis C-methylase UbiE
MNAERDYDTPPSRRESYGREPEVRMSFTGWLFAAMYDRMTAGVEAAGLAKRREELLSTARGRVLEIGAGTGANLAFYSDTLQSVTLAEPERPMVARLTRRVGSLPRQVRIIEAPAEQLPFPDGSFDTVVSTLVLCTVPNQARALAEIRRVLAPGGRLLFIEHVRSDEPRLARWQDRLNGVSQVLAHGCNCNRPTVEAIRAAGFTLVGLTRGELHKAPPFVRPLVVGIASATPVTGATPEGVSV